MFEHRPATLYICRSTSANCGFSSRLLFRYVYNTVLTQDLEFPLNFEIKQKITARPQTLTQLTIPDSSERDHTRTGLPSGSVSWSSTSLRSRSISGHPGNDPAKSLRTSWGSRDKRYRLALHLHFTKFWHNGHFLFEGYNSNPIIVQGRFSSFGEWKGQRLKAIKVSLGGKTVYEN